MYTSDHAKIAPKSIVCYFWRYRLICDHCALSAGQTCSTYGICIQKVSVRNRRLAAQNYHIIHDVSISRVKMRKLLALCNSCHLHPNHIYDVLEDWLVRL